MNKKAAQICSSTFASSDMKRSPSELALEELFKDSRAVEEDHSLNDYQKVIVKDGTEALGDTFHCPLRSDKRSIDTPSSNLSFPLIGNQEIGNGFSRCDSSMDTSPWSRNIVSRHCSRSATIDSQSSICVSSPTSATKSKGRGKATVATSGSSPEQSDDDDEVETEAGPCEQSTDPTDLKRIKRMVSNRESARRSRRRKQAHLADLEQQVEQLRGENGSLFKQLSDATQQYKDATTNNRVLKSDVEALRAKVKLAEDMVTRGSLTSSLSHLLQNYLNPSQSLNNGNMCRGENVSSSITVQGDDPPYPCVGVSAQSAIRMENVDTFNGNLKNGVTNDAMNCVADVWSWESHAASVTK